MWTKSLNWATECGHQGLHEDASYDQKKKIQDSILILCCKLINYIVGTMAK